MEVRSSVGKFCTENGIQHELSAPYNPRSNGLAESGVKIVKYILIKCLGEGKDVQRALYEWRNAPRQHGFSPAQLMFGRSQNALFTQPASAFTPVNLKKAAAVKDKVFDEQAAAYNRDKSELKQLLPGCSVRVQCPKTGSWENIGTVLEIRPDQLSYLIDIEGKMFIRARCMLRPVEEGGVSDASQCQVQVQGGAQAACQEGVFPRRSERLKLRKEKEEIKPISKCAAPMMMMPSSGNTGASTVCTGSNWQSSITSSGRTIPSDKMQGDSPLLMCSGQVLPLGRRPFSSSQSSPSQLSSAVGSGPKGCAGASTVIGSSCRPSPQPSCQSRLPGRGPVPLSPKAPVFISRRQLNGSGPLQVGQVCRAPISPHKVLF